MGWDVELRVGGDLVPVDPFLWGSNVLAGVVERDGEVGEFWLRNGDTLKKLLAAARESTASLRESLAQMRRQAESLPDDLRADALRAVDALEPKDPSTVPLSVLYPDSEETLLLTGQTESRMTVTYNYAALFDFGSLDGRTGAETEGILGEKSDEAGGGEADYWEATPGNVATTCGILVRWARAYPEGVWRVT